MKRYIAIAAGIVAMAVMPATAGLLNSGLPTWQFASTTYGYAASTSFDGNPSSAMCVGCHSVNPSQFIGLLQVTDNGGLTTAQLSRERGSHFVMNVITNNDSDGIGTTATKGGANGGNGMFDQTGDSANKYEKLTDWTTAVPVAGTQRSKYAGATLTGASVKGAAGDMICESCHSIYETVAGDNNLLGAYTDNGDSAICSGCHGDMHANGNLPAFGGVTVRKNHHVLDLGTADKLLTASYASGIMWAPNLSDKVHADWCGSPYKAGITANSIINADITFRNQCNVSGQGAKAIAGIVGDIVGTASALTCANCHRPHNAMSGAGAYILRAGNTGATIKDFNGPQATNQAVAGTNTISYGLRRQVDVGGYASTKIYGDYIPLCAGCHQGYGS